MATTIGIIASYSALAILQGISWLWFLIFQSSVNDYAAFAQKSNYHIVLTPIIGGLVVGYLLARWIPDNRNYGPADVIMAVRENDGQMPLTGSIASALASVISLSSGASLGRYGPTVHLASALASAIGKYGKLPRSEQLILLGCGAASAIAAAFNAPLAGVLFAHEVILNNFARRGFVLITFASVTGYAISKAHGTEVNFLLIEDPGIQFSYEYVLFAILGVLGGALALLFMNGAVVCKRLFDRLSIPMSLKPACAGLLLGLTALEFPQILGVGEQTMHDAVVGVFSIKILFTLLVVKLFAVWISMGGGFGGGVFGPALYLGTMLGSIYGQILGIVIPDAVSVHSAYAIAGMGAVISHVIGAPLATILIVFELTSSYSLTTAVMIAVVLSHVLLAKFHPESWFFRQLKEKGVELNLSREIQLLRRRKIKDLLSSHYVAMSPDTSLLEAEKELAAKMVDNILVCEHTTNKLIGQISIHDINHSLVTENKIATLASLLKPAETLLTMEASLDDAMQMLATFDASRIPVVENISSMKLVGVFSSKDLMDAYRKAVAQARNEERGLI